MNITVAVVEEEKTKKHEPNDWCSKGESVTTYKKYFEITHNKITVKVAGDYNKRRRENVYRLPGGGETNDPQVAHWTILQNRKNIEKVIAHESDA